MSPPTQLGVLGLGGSSPETASVAAARAGARSVGTTGHLMVPTMVTSLWPAVPSAFPFPGQVSRELSGGFRAGEVL